MKEVVFGSCRLILGDFKDHIALLEQATAVVTDPPYGHGYRVNARSWSNKGLKGTRPISWSAKRPIHGYATPFNAGPLLSTARCALFGANHYEGLPAGGRWLVWDKRRDSRPDSHSDCELIWTNVPGADRIHRQKWRGIVREGEENASRSRKLHPNQKPVDLLSFVFDQIGIQPGETVLDPFMGSGSTGVVAVRRGNPFIGIEIDPEHFNTACERLAKEAA